MKILLIGSGGRENSLAIKIAESKLLTKLYIAPGNPGTAEIGENVNIKINDYEALINFVKTNKIDLTFVGPELPLTDGIQDIFAKHNLTLIGPNKLASQLENSKKWTKELLKKYQIPTADFEVFSDYQKALDYLKTKNTYPIVIKADGLAQGKGVAIPYNFTEAETVLKNCFIDQIFGNSGLTVVIEEFLQGQELSILAFTDGKTILPMTSAQDHKAIFDNDKGPNTGGMGAYSPVPLATKKLEEKVYQKILLPTLQALQSEGITYQGILYAGLMIQNNEPYVIEFNIRFGDPETQVILPRLENDLLEIFLAIKNQELDKVKLEWKNKASVTIVLASQGYPGKYETNKVINIPTELLSDPDLQIIHAGTALNTNNQLVTNGGRVLNIVALGNTLQDAINKAYETEKLITFEGKYCRKDIGKKGL